MLRPVPVLIALVLVAVGGLAHGLATSRWHRSEALETAVARVPQVPTVIGAWKGQDLEADPKAFARAHADAYWIRRYERSSSKAAVTVILMCGRSGPLAVHTPDVCYRGAGYEMAGAAEHVEVPVAGTGAAQLWTARFQKEQATAPDPLRLYWTWSADGTWLAPALPRFTFAGRPALYKLYVIHELPAGEAPADRDPVRAFLPELLGALDRTLFRPPDS